MDKQYIEYDPMEKVEEPSDMDREQIPRPLSHSGKGSRSNLTLRLGQVPWYTSGFQ